MNYDQSMKYLGYADNILIQACGNIPNDKELVARLTYLPAVFPRGFDFRGNSIMAGHYAESVRAIHIPSSEGIAIAQAIDLMLRQGYVGRNPSSPSTWKEVYQPSIGGPPSLSAQASYIGGISGTGKSRSVERPLQFYEQVVIHDSFPQMRSKFKQLVWLKVNVPPNGSARELAYALMRATDQALGTSLHRDYETSRKTGLELLNTWWDTARCHFLGLLVLDEASNFFKIETLQQRLKRNIDSERLHLRVADDEALKFIIDINNTSKIPLLLLGTPDGMEAFCTRLSTVERLATGGIYHVSRCRNEVNSYYRKHMFPNLDKFRLGKRNVGDAEILRDRLFELTAGVPRIFVSLWCLSARVMVSRNGDSLEVADLEYVMDHYMAPLKQAVNALHSDDPRKLARYEDALPPPEFWAGLFSNKAS